ncbi:rod shape-determining protein [Pseudomonas sp. GD04087]|uniref:rod shape-determining protein n=1 Tax=Pseudomonas TaxID=286 RepID=UPI001F218990|nr:MULTISPECIES: rod shape-determining protein [Pseudomonas]MDH0289719.1 rod shape-determining protein [Pseudomonas sp. GD04087]MDH1048224.1 rod shape-determining protein [Pseudomonas sp. GD03903]MDH2002232.1 rod shape-determining protein [Pseudomonas sp. GD03691]
MLDHFSSTLYLKLSRHWISGVVLPSGEAFAEPPLLAVRYEGGKPKVLAAGAAARQLQGQDGIEIVNGFDHPRSLLANFSFAEMTLKLLVGRLVPRSLLKAAPVLILHPQELLEGGLTQVEVRGLYELCRGAGARKVRLWTGRELSQDELRSGQLPAGDGTEWLP